jgi:group I intron endonuclease
MLIYLLTNLTNGKMYVGQTRILPVRRWKQHVRDARNDSTTLIGRAIRKHGPYSFSLTVLCSCVSQAELDEKEIEYIAKLGTHAATGNGYNLTAGGFGGHHGAVGPMKNKHHSDATRRQMHFVHLGKPCPSRGRPGGAAHLQGLPRSDKGRKASQVVAKAMGLANKGKVTSERTRQSQATGTKYITLYMRDWRAARQSFYGT